MTSTFGTFTGNHRRFGSNRNQHFSRNDMKQRTTGTTRLHLPSLPLATSSDKQVVAYDSTTEAASSDKQLVLCAPTPQLRVRPNIALLKPVRFYVADDDDSVPYAFMLGRLTISTSRGQQEALLPGYFSALCAVFPDLTDIAKRVMKSLGFQAVEIMVPSQAAEKNIEIPRSQDLKQDLLNFAQICFLPFLISFESDVNAFWTRLGLNAGIELPYLSLLLCSVTDMKTIKSAFLLSGLWPELERSIACSWRALAATTTPLGLVLSEAAKLNERYETVFSYGKISYKGMYRL